MSPDALQIGVVGGTGAEGRGIAQRFAQAGVRVCIGSRDAVRATDVAAALTARLTSGSLVGADNGRAIAASDIVMLSVPFAHRMRPTLSKGIGTRSGPARWSSM
jgi:predicted dinucleotide-binding enzyme